MGMIEASKDTTLNEMVFRLEEDQSASIGRSTLDVWLRKPSFTFKKDRTCIGAGAGSPPESGARHRQALRTARVCELLGSSRT